MKARHRQPYHRRTQRLGPVAAAAGRSSVNSVSPTPGSMSRSVARSPIARPSGRALLVTSALHAAFCMIAASVFLPTAIGPAAIDTVAEWGTEAEPLTILPRPVEEMLAPVDPTEVATPVATTVAVPDVAPLAEADAAPSATETASFSLESAVATADAAAEAGPPSTAGGGGEGKQGTNGGGPLAAFLGENAGGKKVVFVVDASTSMRRPFMKTRYPRFRVIAEEMRSSILSLDDDQEFFVVLFNHEAHPMPVPRMVPVAETDLRDRLLAWVGQTVPGGETEPSAALAMALRIEPDVIFFLSDGNFEHVLKERYTQANTGHIPTHVVAISEESDAEMLRQLAHENGGRYLEIGVLPESERGGFRFPFR